MIAATEEHRVDAAGVRLAAVELGDRSAPTVVLLHGYPDTKEMWEDVAHRLAQRLHVVAYDMRGAGASSAPAGGAAAYDLERLVDDFVAVIDAVVPGRPVHLVGHDWGSISGWEMVATPRLEGRVLSFTSINGPSLDHAGHWMRDRLRRPGPRALAALAGQARRSWYVAAFQVPLLPELTWRMVMARRWAHVLHRVEGVPADAARVSPTLATDAAHGLGLYRRNMRRRLRSPRADAPVHVPVQLVVARRDHFISPRLLDGVERWAPSLRRRTVDAGHWLPRTHPGQVARWIEEFVGEVEAGTATPPAPDPARPFAGRLVLVTGAGSGIGRATALAFADAGARVLAVDIDAAAAERTAELARLCGAAEAAALRADVADADAMERLDRDVAERHGVVDVLVNNAGIGVAGSFLDTPVEEWRRVLDVNLWGVLHGCRLVARRMVERGGGGHIVNVASAAAFTPSKALPAYSTSKAAVLMLSECLRAELAPQGIGVSAICPGFVSTNITRTTSFVGRSAEEEERLRARSTRLYRRRNYPPERVAEAILDAVERDRAVVPVTVEARAMRLLSRAAPGVMRALAKLDAL